MNTSRNTLKFINACACGFFHPLESLLNDISSNGSSL